MSNADIWLRLASAKRPIFFFGHGVRLAGAVPLAEGVVRRFGVPALTSWSAADFSDYELFFGRTGTYGQRCANTIVQEADLIVAVGTRLAIPQIGYDITQFAPNADIFVVDIDPAEASKYARFHPIVMDAGAFLRNLLWFGRLCNPTLSDWRIRCRELRAQYPWLETGAHDDPPGYISPYKFMAKLQPYLRDDEVIVTEMGAALMCSYQILHLKPPQRIITTQGLGEMGWGLPAAIGASFARNRGEVLCLNTDGGMMFNLQELQTIVHHDLPIKIIVFSNDGYGMIKHTQEALGHMRSGVDTDSGVSMPDFRSVAEAFGIMDNYCINDWDDFDQVIPCVFESKHPVLVEVGIEVVDTQDTV